MKEISYKDLLDPEKNIERWNRTTDKETPIKKWLLEYIGTKNNTEEITTDMISRALEDEFSEYYWSNGQGFFISGYRQAFADMEEFEKQLKNEATDESPGIYSEEI